LPVVCALFAALLAACPSTVAAAEEGAVSLDAIVSGMMQQKERQDLQLLEFRALRRFHAANLRFKVEARQEVETVFRRAEPLDSRVLRHSGSELIRNRVFDRILQAERETSGRKEKAGVDITPANYEFSFVSVTELNGRRAYRLSVSPRRKGQYFIRGTIWVDAEDFGIARITGSPAKRPSFWTLRTTLDRTYERVHGLWLPKRLESVSDIFMAGRSTLAIDSEYGRILAEPRVSR
jgi:hypothetical protein